MAEMPPTTHPTGRAGAGHESRDVALRPIAMGLVGLFVLLGLILLLTGWVFEVLRAREARRDVPPSPLATPQPPPEPRLQVAPATDLMEMRAAEEAQLHGYGWADRGAGIVRIPIERAMEVLAQRGLPVRPPPARKE